MMLLFFWVFAVWMNIVNNLFKMTVSTRERRTRFLTFCLWFDLWAEWILLPAFNHNTVFCFSFFFSSNLFCVHLWIYFFRTAVRISEHWFAIMLKVDARFFFFYQIRLSFSRGHLTAHFTRYKCECVMSMYVIFVILAPFFVFKKIASR